MWMDDAASFGFSAFVTALFDTRRQYDVTVSDSDCGITCVWAVTANELMLMGWQGSQASKQAGRKSAIAVKPV